MAAEIIHPTFGGGEAPVVPEAQVAESTNDRIVINVHNGTRTVQITLDRDSKGIWHYRFPTFRTGLASPYDRASTRSKDAKEASAIALARFSAAKHAHEHGLTQHIPTLKAVIADYCVSMDALVLRGEKTQQSRDHDATRLERFIAPYLGEKKLSQLDDDTVTLEYHKKRIEDWQAGTVRTMTVMRLGHPITIKLSPQFTGQPSAAQLKKDVELLNRLLDWAVRKKLITLNERGSRLSPVPRQHKRRGIIIDDGWTTLLTALRERAEQGHKRTRFGRRMLYLYTLFLALSGVRPGNEVNDAVFGDCTLLDSGRVQFKVGDGKMGRRTIECDPDLCGVIEALKDAQRSLGIEPTETSPLWISYEKRPIEFGYHKQMKVVLRELGLDKDSEGNDCTLYSMRHQFITAQRKAGAQDWAIEKHVASTQWKTYFHLTPAEGSRELKSKVIPIR